MQSMCDLGAASQDILLGIEERPSFRNRFLRGLVYRHDVKEAAFFERLAEATLEIRRLSETLQRFEGQSGAE